MFRFNGLSWIQEQKLTSPNRTESEAFGNSVSIDANVIVVGAAGGACADGVSCGAAYAFRFNGTMWVLGQKLIAPDPHDGDVFGVSVGVSGDVIVVGASSDDCQLGINCGSAHVFRFNGLSWSLESTLTAPDAGVGGAYGLPVAMSGNRAAIGANLNGCNPGQTCSRGVYIHTVGVDCNANGRVDPCDLQDGDSADVDGNAVPDECLLATPLPNETRFLTFAVPAVAVPSAASALRVRMLELQNPQPPNLPQSPPPDFSAFEAGPTCTDPAGCARWVGPLTTFLESQDNAAFGTFRAARLQCTPYYHDWSTEGFVHVTGAEIIPSSRYEVQALAAACMGSEAMCADVSAPLLASTARFGDVATPFNPPMASSQPDALDVVGSVNKFKSLPGSPAKVAAQIQPNVVDLNANINALDVSTVIDALKSRAYPFSGPCVCPPTVPCNTTSCGAGDPPCSFAHGPGALCVRACIGGANGGLPCNTDKHCNYCVGGSEDGLPCEPAMLSACPGGFCPGDGACGDGFCRDRCGRCQ